MSIQCHCECNCNCINWTHCFYSFTPNFVVVCYMLMLFFVAYSCAYSCPTNFAKYRIEGSVSCLFVMTDWLLASLLFIDCHLMNLISSSSLLRNLLSQIYTRLCNVMTFHWGFCCFVLLTRCRRSAGRCCCVIVNWNWLVQHWNNNNNHHNHNSVRMEVS